MFIRKGRRWCLGKLDWIDITLESQGLINCDLLIFYRTCVTIKNKSLLGDESDSFTIEVPKGSGIYDPVTSRGDEFL